MNSSGEELPVEELPVEEFEFSAEEIPTTEEIPGEEIPVVAFSALDFPTEEEWLAGILAEEELPPTDLSPAEELPEEEWPVVEEVIATDISPAEELPAEELPVEEWPVVEEVIATDISPTEEVPAEEVPTEEVPAEEVPAEAVPATDISPTEDFHDVEEIEIPEEEIPATDISPIEESPVLSIPEFNVINLPFSEDFSQYKNICFISSIVDTFSQYLNSDTYPVIYNDSADRERLKTDLLSQFNTIDRVCFVFHGPSSAIASNSSLFAPKTFIHKEKFFTITEDDAIEGGENLVFIQELCNALQVKHVDFLACNLLQSLEWQKYFALFPSNVVVGASDNNSGNLKYGGDWILENTMEDIREIYFTTGIENYASLLAALYNLNTYYHTFYTVSTTTPTVMTRTIYDNFGGLVDTTDISFGGQNIADTMALMNAGGTNPFTIGIADSAQNKISMDIASCELFTKELTSNQKTKLMSYVNTTFKEPRTILTGQYKVTVSAGTITLADSNGNAVQSIALSAGNTYYFDLSDTSNTGSVFKLSSSATSLTEITSGVTRYNTPGTLNAYMTISPVLSSMAYLFDPVRYYYVKVYTNIVLKPVFAISATTAGGTYYNQPDISFVSGNSYRFNVSDSSVTGYSLVFGSNEIANTSLYTTSGTPGQAGAYVSLDLTAGYSGATIRYFELTRTGMGYTPYVNPAPAAPDNVWYKFEKGDISGTTVKNYATNTFTGTIAVPNVVDAVSLSSTNNIDSSTNVVGMSSLFLDSKQYINFSTNSVSGTTKPPSALLSVSFWAKNTLTSITRKDFPIWYYGPGPDWISSNNFYISYGVWTEPSKLAISFSFNNALYWTTEAQTGTFRTDGKWHHFCVVADLTTVKLYYDATMVINKNVTNPVNTSQNYTYRYLGTDFYFNVTPATGPHFKGYFDDYRMYNSALTAADVSGLYSYRTEYAVSISGGVIYLNGIYNPIVTFVAGGRYIFDQSGNSNVSNQIMFSRVASGNPTFTDGVTVVGTPGQAGAYTRVDLSGGFTGTLYYLSQSTFIPTFSSITTAVGSKFYFNADTPENYVLDAGNNVTRWKNKISGQVDASANTTNINNVNSSIYTYPKIVTNIPNGGGLPFMKLSGGADQVGFNFNGGNLITGTELNQQTLFMFGYMYGTRVDTGSNGMFFAKYGPYSGAGILHVTWDNANSKIYVINNGGTSNTDNILNVNPGYYMISITIDCSGGSSSLVNIRGYGITDLTRVNYIIDDGTVNKSMTGTSRTSDLHNFQIGYWEAGNNSYRRSMNGAIGETMYFNRILSKNERYILEGKIAWKYGQASILPATHPYKTFSPSETAPPVTNAVTISGGLVYLNGVANPTVTFVAGGRYIFDQSAASNLNNQISFSRVSNGNPTFTDGVTVVGTPGQAGAYTQLDLSGSFTGTLYYFSQSTFIPTFSSITTAVGSKFYFNADTSANYVLDASNNVTRWKNRISGGLDASANTYGGYNNNQFPKIVNNVSFAGGLPFMKLAGGGNQVGFNYSGGGLAGSELNQQTFFMFGYMYGKNTASAASAFFAKPGVYGAGGNTLHIHWENSDLKLYAINVQGNASSANILNENPGYYMFSITVDCSASSQVNIQAYGLLDTNRTQQYTIDDGTTNRAFAINKTSDLHNFQIGFWDDLLNNHKRSLNSAIGETMYFNRILSKNERYILEGKIAWKYGQASILPATHPYKTFSPV